MLLRTLIFTLFLYLIPGLASASCYTKHKCGHWDDWHAKPCKVWECVPSCSHGNHEDIIKGKCIKNDHRSCFQKNHCGGAGQKACFITQCVHACKSGLKQFGSGFGDSVCGNNCFDVKHCGKNNQKPCVVTSCLPSCDKGLYEDVAKNKCLRPNGKPIWAATFFSLGKAVKKVGKSCRQMLDIFPKPNSAKALSQAQLPGYCVNEAEVGFLCGVFSATGSIFSAIGQEGKNLSEFRNAIEHEMKSSSCHNLDPISKGYCGTMRGLSHESVKSFNCVKNIAREFLKESKNNKGHGKTDYAQITKSVCQEIGDFAFSALVDQMALNQLSQKGTKLRKLLYIAQKFRTALSLQALAQDELKERFNRIPDCNL